MDNDRPNVVFIMTDQQRADSFGANRHPCADYPTMEKLSSESVTFSHCVSSAVACVPSRHSFLTGRQPWILGCDGNTKYSMADETTWMSILRSAGYTCVSVGKTHSVHAGSYHIQVPLGKTFGDLPYWDHFHPAASPEAEDRYFDIYATQRACEALDCLQEHAPFAMFLGLHAPHEPYSMPEKYLSFCRPKSVSLPESCLVDEYYTKSEPYRKRVDLFKRKFGPITDDLIRAGIAGHHCMLKMVDDCLSRLLQSLEEHGLLSNALVVFCSDHGDVLGEHRIFNKAATFYEGEVRIPLMIRFPGRQHAGKKIDHLVSSIDFVPTLFDILDMSPDISLPGRSMLPMIEQGEAGREYVTCSTGPGMMIRTERYKLWKTVDSDGEMYDLENDPKEMVNLYGDPEFSQLRSYLVELMLNSRMKDDLLNNRATESEYRLRMEVKASLEPEVV